MARKTAKKEAATRAVRSATRKPARKPAAAKQATKAAKKPASTPSKKPVAKPAAKTAKPKLLSGDNPQIAKGDGDAPVQAYIAAIPGWRRDIARRLDTLIAATVPNVRKAVKWNSPFYGVEEKVWFLSFHCFTNFVKVAFFNGASLTPLPPGASKQKNVRYLDIPETDGFDETQIAAWVKQASAAEGVRS